MSIRIILIFFGGVDIKVSWGSLLIRKFGVEFDYGRRVVGLFGLGGMCGRFLSRGSYKSVDNFVFFDR